MQFANWQAWFLSPSNVSRSKIAIGRGFLATFGLNGAPVLEFVFSTLLRFSTTILADLKRPKGVSVEWHLLKHRIDCFSAAMPVNARLSGSFPRSCGGGWDGGIFASIAPIPTPVAGGRSRFKCDALH